MNVVHGKNIESRRGPDDKFAGMVWSHLLYAAQQTGEPSVYYVLFGPGARTNWHAHPGGQILYVTAGIGRVQEANGPMVEIHPGDVVHISPDEKHWHGAAPGSFMAHVAINSGGASRWMRPVTDREYSNP